ncbi:uncharacterized protein TNIN_65941 [Trichonephila inaurata madagascariensis]|uniref:Uncharacterized protein n=1 Tax=Trichonephila inaurata madagascariensis TaxID=2747483 RepID=A0A8X6X6Y7_9ARAC|nr:uncharacterized protein TNIN_65941 [Trichonephila inaurata madagascariensis]
MTLNVPSTNGVLDTSVSLLMAYIPETNTCKTLVKIMTERDFMQFTKGKPSVHGLTHAHSYPINVQCHNGVKDPKGRWCVCNSGWDSAEFDHRNFNLDVQVYHMCTVWMGKMTAEQAKNITVQMINRHAITTGVIVSFLSYLSISKVSLKAPHFDFTANLTRHSKIPPHMSSL